MIVDQDEGRSGQRAAPADDLADVDPKDDSKRVLAVVKSNLGPIPPSHGYLIDGALTARVMYAG